MAGFDHVDPANSCLLCDTTAVGVAKDAGFPDQLKNASARKGFHFQRPDNLPCAADPQNNR
jgi:hypothetical protein